MEVERAGQGWGVNEGLHLGCQLAHLCEHQNGEGHAGIWRGE